MARIVVGIAGALAVLLGAMAARRLGRYPALPFPFWAGLAGGLAVSGEAFLLNPKWINGSEPLLAALGAAFFAVAAAAALGTLDVERWSLGLSGGLVEAEVEPVLPEGWCWNADDERAAVVAPARTDGLVDRFCARPDASVRVWLAAPEDARPGRYTIPFRVTWGGRYLGQLRHAIVEVR
jgi:hypothetical protein